MRDNRLKILKETWSQLEADAQMVYEDNVKYHQVIPEIKFMNPQIIKRLNSSEVGSVPDDVAASMDFSEPIDVSIYRDGEIICQNGHHRLAAAKQRGMKLINVKVQAINAYGKMINELIRNQEIRESRLVEMPAWNDGNKDISNYVVKQNKREVLSMLNRRGMTLVDEFNISGYKAETWSRRDNLQIHLYNAEGTHVGEFIWYTEDGQWKTESVALAPEAQGKGIAIKLYIYAIEEFMKTLYSDTSLTGETGKGSFDVWVKLGKYFNFKYVYNEEENMLEAVDEFTRDMMGSENIRFVVSTEYLIEDDTMNETLVSLPTNSIRQWLSKNIDELLQKIQETYTQGYNTYVEDSIEMDGRSISVNIQKKLLSTSPDIESALYFNEKEDAIYISADSLVSNLKKLDKIKAFVTRGIWHELTHVNDPNRLQHKQDLSSYAAYINSPREFPAFARMFIEEIRDADKSLRDAVLVAIQQDKKIPMKDIDTWYKKLTPENKEKFKAYCQSEFAGPNA